MFLIGLKGTQEFLAEPQSVLKSGLDCIIYGGTFDPRKAFIEEQPYFIGSAAGQQFSVEKLRRKVLFL
jgi:hypothetical protein